MPDVFSPSMALLKIDYFPTKAIIKEANDAKITMVPVAGVIRMKGSPILSHMLKEMRCMNL
jgi:hypothetical protein